MLDTFGARVRRHREQRGISLAEIAEQTKIKASLLEGLERDDISHWPAGIFRRAYLRAYATAIGFDADAAVREFLTIHPDPVEVAEPTPPPMRLRSLVDSAFGSLRRPKPAPRPPDAAVPVPGGGGLVAESNGRILDLDPRALDLEPVTPAPEPRTAIPDAPPSTPEIRTAPLAARASDFLAAAKVCTELGRVADVAQVPPLLREAAELLDARGLILWLWNAGVEQLTPAFVHGYPSQVRARLRGVSASADNVTAAAFRAGAPLAVSGTDQASGALAVPLLSPSACTGVLAVELTDGREQDPAVRAITTFLAAMLALLVTAPPAEPAEHPADNADSVTPSPVRATPA
jgi:transcriptional regulator with XRE-family HTH domain